jgi:hypothetical protein
MEIDKDLINRLLQESFGDGFRGDYIIERSIFRPNINTSPDLNEIARVKSFLGVFAYTESVGRFVEQDGSRIELRKNSGKYENCLLRYSSLYQELTGKEVLYKIK